MKKSGPDRKYTQEFRLAAVKQVIDGGRSIPQVARSLEMSPGTLGNWVARTRKGEVLMRASTGATGQRAGGRARTAEAGELAATDREGNFKKRPIRLAAALMHRNIRRVPCRTARTVADSFLEVSTPSKKPGPGEAADPSVVAPSGDPV